MPDYTPNEIADIMLILGECQKCYRAAARLYQERFPERQHHPDHTVIKDIEMRLRQGNLVRNRRSFNEEDYENNPRVLALLAMIHINVHLSLREIENTLGIPRSTSSRYLKNVKYHPYHVTLNQALSEADHRQRVIFCQWATQKIVNDPNFFNYVLFSDEATFHSTGSLNRHNSHYWSPVNPHWMQEIDHQHRWSLTVWCGIINGCLVGPYFFDGNVTGETYLHFIRDELNNLLEDVDLYTRERMWLQQDGAAPHYARIVKDYLNVRFRNKWIGRGGPIQWPPRSPDLTSPDFYLWGFLKNTVYRNRPITKEDMQERITEACLNIPREVLLKTIAHFKKRIKLCIQVNGTTFEHLQINDAR